MYGRSALFRVTVATVTTDSTSPGGPTNDTREELLSLIPFFILLRCIFFPDSSFFLRFRPLIHTTASFLAGTTSYTTSPVLHLARISTEREGMSFSVHHLIYLAGAGDAAAARGG
jgi:hypothetical protein